MSAAAGGGASGGSLRRLTAARLAGSRAVWALAA